MTAELALAKCARRLIPFMVLLYVVNFLDRVNVGFAALTMNKDLGFSPSTFGLGAGVFFLAYFLFQVPANVALDRIGARRWMFAIMLVWGAISAANALVTNAATFFTLRFLLGAAEAGFFPGMLLYLTYWFPQSYRARFTADFMIGIPLAFVIGGPLSSTILGLDGAAGLKGWQWLFLAEGAPAILLAFAVLRFLPDRPQDADWLSAEEKSAIAARLAAEEPAGEKALLPALFDPRIYGLGLALFGVVMGYYGAGLWLPQIVHAMGFTVMQVGFVVAIPFAIAGIAMVVWGRSSDRSGERIWHTVVASLLSAAGFAAASQTESIPLELLALTCAAAGVLAAHPPLWSLPSSFLGGTGAAGGIGLVNAIGGLGGFLGPYVIGAIKENTGSYSGGMMALSAALLVSVGIMLALGRAMAARRIPQPSPGSG
jgi:ACS family tartrate transporter-like MFS transporter